VNPLRSAGEIHQSIRDVVNGQPYVEVTLAATSRKGQPFQCRVSASPLTGPDRAVTGVILMMEEHPRQALAVRSDH
jgi:hypothetical protein